MALPKFPKGKLWLPFCRFPESGSFTEALNVLLAKYRFQPLDEPEIIIRCYRKDNLLWRNVIFKTDIEATDASVWHKTSKHQDLQYAKYKSSEFLDDRGKILSHRIMTVQFFKKPLTADEVQLFESAAFTAPRINAICCILMDMIWPCELFDIDSFRIVLRRLYNGDLKNTKAMFGACTVANGCFAEPSEILKLLACLEPTASGKTRFDFIFRFYADSRSAELTVDQVETLINEVCREDLSEVMAQHTRKFYADMFSSGAVSIEKFRSVLTSARESLRRTKDVLRAPRSLFSTPDIDNYTGVVFVDTEKSLRPREFATHFKLTKQTLRIPLKARLVVPLPWWRFCDTNSRTDSMDGYDPGFDLRHRFDATYEPNALLEDLKLYASRFKWLRRDSASLAEKFLGVCAMAKEIFATEQRLLLLESPVYIFGDIHGSYEDLLVFERAFWRLGPNIAPSSYLFLGNYVDHGPSNLAVVGHLFACKVLAPNNFFLIRGAHEDRTTNRTGGLLDECTNVFGKRGLEVYEAINATFDVLPLAAIVDQKLFCVHGGIPEGITSTPYLGAINSIKVDLSKPRKDPIASELLWNDPNHQSDLVNDYQPKDPPAVGKFFSPTAVNNFLKQFNMSFVIRAHECERPESDTRFTEQLVTLNSSIGAGSFSKTSTACILAADNNIRYIQLCSTEPPEPLKSGDE